MHSWCKKCKQYDGRESKNVPCRRKALGAAWHMWLPSLGSTPGSGTRRGRFNHRAAIARALPPADFRRLPPTNRKCCGPWTQRPFSGSGFGPGSPSLVFPHPALRPATPHQGLGGWVLRPFPYPYPAKQRVNASWLDFSIFRDTYTKPCGLWAAGDL